MPLYDYLCNQGHVTEKLVGGRVETIPCPLCGQDARRSEVCRVSYVIKNQSERIGKKYDRFKEASAEIDYTCKKFESETNAKVPDLGLWQKAKQAVKHEL